MANVDVVRDAPALPQNPIDTSAPIPPAVKAAAERANALHQQAYAPPAAPADPTPEPPPPAAPAVPALSPEEMDHRFKSAEGRYKTAAAQNAALLEQIAKQNDEIARLQQVARPAAPQTPVLTDKDKELYGDELIDFVKRAAQEVVAPVQQAVQQVTAQTQNVARATQQASARSITEALDQDIPDWRQINGSAEWKAWLALPDVYSGVPRIQLLNAANKAGSPARVVAFFRGFLSDYAAQQPPAAPNAEPAPPPAQPRQPAVSLEMIAAPGRPQPAGGSTPTPADQQPSFTRAEVAKFYSDVRKGLYAGREQEKMTVERQIFAAQGRPGGIR